MCFINSHWNVQSNIQYYTFASGIYYIVYLNNVIWLNKNQLPIRDANELAKRRWTVLLDKSADDVVASLMVNRHIGQNCHSCHNHNQRMIYMYVYIKCTPHEHSRARCLAKKNHRNRLLLSIRCANTTPAKMCMCLCVCVWLMMIFGWAITLVHLLKFC